MAAAAGRTNANAAGRSAWWMSTFCDVPARSPFARRMGQGSQEFLQQAVGVIRADQAIQPRNPTRATSPAIRVRERISRTKNRTPRREFRVSRSSLSDAFRQLLEAEAVQSIGRAVNSPMRR